MTTYMGDRKFLDACYSQALSALKNYEVHASNRGDQAEAESYQRMQQALEPCTVIDKDELARLRRALWMILENHQHGVPRSMSDLLAEAGLLKADVDTDEKTGIKYTYYDWTPAAHAFAREMQGGKEPK